MKQGAPEPIAALNRVQILDTGEPLVDIRDFCPGVEVREEACPYLRETTARMLNSAQESLPPGRRFRVGTALRTLSMQRRGWDNYFRQMQEARPEWPLSALRRATNRFFAPYDQPAPPGHCTGGAVDVNLIGPDGQPLDVTSPLEGWQAAYTWSDRLTPEALQNRMTLVEAMLGAGFSNCREEYWHYSWGDSAWAVRVGEKSCPYGLVKAPPSVEARFMGGSAESIRQIGPHRWACAARDGLLDLAILWCEECRVELMIEPLDLPRFYLSADRKRWVEAEASKAGGALVVAMEPDAPRLFIRSSPLPADS